jgi:hypothetical protein
MANLSSDDYNKKIAEKKKLAEIKAVVCNESSPIQKRAKKR